MSEAISKRATDGISTYADAVRGYVEGSRSESTKRSYRQHWTLFCVWCQGEGVEALPASESVVGAYLASLAQAGRSAGTVAVVYSVIRSAHRMAGHEPPAGRLIRDVIRGIRKASAPVNRKAAITKSVLKELVSDLSDDLAGARDRALLLLGFAGGFRRSELAALQVSDVEVTDEGLRVAIRRSKTDQLGDGSVIGIRRSMRTRLCPVKALEDWLEASGIEEGSLLRSVNRHGQLGRGITGRSIARRLKTLAERSGLDIDISGHSLRAGMATTAAQAGVSTGEIMRQGRWKSSAIVDSVYVRPATIFANKASSLL